jgi:hypothetical protein
MGELPAWDRIAGTRLMPRHDRFESRPAAVSTSHARRGRQMVTELINHGPAASHAEPAELCKGES